MARENTGLAKYAYLVHAIELAELHALGQSAEDLRAEVQQIPPDEFELHAISAEVQLPQEEIDRYVSTVVGDDDLESDLERFGTHVPTGSPSENRDFVHQMMQEHPIQYLVTGMRIGP